MPAPDLESYFARVDKALADMTVEDGRAFLERLSNQWERDYGDWQRRIHMGQPTRGNATAWDYLETISGIEQRKFNATREVCDDLRRWQEAYRKALKYNAGVDA